LQENNDRMLLLLVKANALVINKIKWIIKPHPACPILSQDYPELNAVITDNPIEELTGQCMAAYASSVTSAAVDVYYSGIPVITLLDPKKLDLSPLRGCDGVFPVENADELAILLDSLNSIVVKDKRGEGYFYLNSKLPRWRRLLVGNDS
jgi:surface carbohydrate biosynthesis protein (TIGR04326 family)